MMHESSVEAELLDTIADVVRNAGGTVTVRDAHALTGTLTAIRARWFLGGRKVTDSVTCRLFPETHEAHLRETAVETSWGLPPPTLTVRTTAQAGGRVKETRVDTGTGGGGILEFGRFRESVERAVSDAGWVFVFEVA